MRFMKTFRLDEVSGGKFITLAASVDCYGESEGKVIMDEVKCPFSGTDSATTGQTVRSSTLKVM